MILPRLEMTTICLSFK